LSSGKRAAPLIVWDVEKDIVRRARIEDLVEAVYMLTALVPAGRVVSYSDIAKTLHVHPRFVGYALRLNKNPIIVPCHRVVRSDGRLGGYSYGGAKIKEKLLRLEGVAVVNGRIPRRFFTCLRDIMK